ncbi:autolysin, partial [Staphylococcus epidermidis]|nr:autolysin [Staphylococcus epidermidis]
MTKHKKGSILAIIGLLIVFVVTGFIFFSMISDQIFFKHVKPVEKVEKLDKTLDKASKKQIHNYTSQQVSNKANTAWRDASGTEIKEAMDSSKFIDDDKQKYQFLD